jgi:parvulin-like peptidyl-prolyl isomerase
MVMQSPLSHYVPAGLPGFPNNLQLNQETGRAVLKNLIINKVELQIAKSKNVPVEQADLDRSFEDYRLLQQAQSSLPYETQLAEQGYTPDQFKHEVLAPQVAEINLLQTRVIISDEALQELYKSTESGYTLPAGVHVHRVVCATENQADNVAKGLKAGHVISDYIADNIARDGIGGNPADDTDFVNWINTDRPDPALGKAGAALKAAKQGDIVGPYQVGGAWWVFQVSEKRASQLLPFDQVKDLVRINYVRKMSGPNGNDLLKVTVLQDLHDSVVKINIPAYQNLALAMHDMGMTQQNGVPQSGVKPK